MVALIAKATFKVTTETSGVFFAYSYRNCVSIRHLVAEANDVSAGIYGDIVEL